MVTFDTSALLALLDRREAHHTAVIDLARRERGPLILPVGILGETCYFIERALGPRGLRTFFQDVQAGVYPLHCGESLIERVTVLIDRHHVLSLGYVDAAVIACADRHGGRVATLDHRHFGVVGREG